MTWRTLVNVICSRLKKTGCCSLLIFVLKASAAAVVPALTFWSRPTCTKAWEFMCEMPVPWLRQLVTSLSPQSLWLDPRPDHAGFEVDKVAMRQVFL